MKRWLENDEVSFLNQDEELIIAMFSTSLLLETISIGRKNTKLGIIYEAMAIKLYDEDFSNEEDKTLCVNWLKNNRKLWEPVSMDYIKNGIQEELGSRQWPFQ